MENMLNKRELAELLKVSVKTIDNWRSQGKGPKSIRIGRMIRFKQSEVELFIKQLSEGK